jgi:zinc transport system substrate-binding protein
MIPVIVLLISCGRSTPLLRDPVISVSIAPFKYFIRQIGGDDFSVNVMVPPGADPHIYEPYPRQISYLRRSVAYVSNGFLGFEMTWLDRFYEANTRMKKLNIGDRINPIVAEHEHSGDHVEGADPHYWVSLRSAMIIAASVLDLLKELNPEKADDYESNYWRLAGRIEEADSIARGLFEGIDDKAFMIFHPTLGYLARDYGLEEISLEHEGKEPSPARMKELIDRARKENIGSIFIQREHDTRNARTIADEIGAEIVTIDPLSEDWLSATRYIIDALHKSFIRQTQN